MKGCANILEDLSIPVGGNSRKQFDGMFNALHIKMNCVVDPKPTEPKLEHFAAVIVTLTLGG